jgi:hypothetical protein
MTMEHLNTEVKELRRQHEKMSQQLDAESRMKNQFDRESKSSARPDPNLPHARDERSRARAPLARPPRGPSPLVPRRSTRARPRCAEPDRARAVD